MTTISVPIPRNLEDFINDVISRGEAETKAEVVRRALTKMAENDVINQILISQKEIEEGKILKGNLKDIIKKIK